MNQIGDDDRSSKAKAYHWASRIMTVCLEMVVPGLLGYGLLDRNLGTRGLFTLVGFSLGMVLGIWHLLKMTERDASSDGRHDTTH